MIADAKSLITNDSTLVSIHHSINSSHYFSVFTMLNVPTDLTT